MDERQRCYLGAVALNNAAITLLERGCCHRARTVLQDALQTIRDVKLTRARRRREDGDESSLPAPHLPRPGEPGASWADDRIILDAKLAKASRFILESAQPEGANPAPTVKMESHVLDMDTPRLFVLGTAFPSVTPVTLIRIDPAARGTVCVQERPDGGGDETGTGPLLETFIMLHNFAAAVRLHPLSEQELRRSAVRGSRLAFSLAVRFLYGDGSDGELTRVDHGGPFVALATLQLSVLMAQCYYQLCVDLCDSADAWQAITQYRAVQGALVEEEVRFANVWVWASAVNAKAA